MLNFPWDSTVPPVRPNRRQPEVNPPCHPDVFIFRNLFHSFTGADAPGVRPYVRGALFGIEVCGWDMSNVRGVCCFGW